MKRIDRLLRFNVRSHILYRKPIWISFMLLYVYKMRLTPQTSHHFLTRQDVSLCT